MLIKVGNTAWLKSRNFSHE